MCIQQTDALHLGRGWDSRPVKVKIQLQKPVFERRAALAKDVKGFWPTSLQQCEALSRFLDPADLPALAHLTDVWIEHDTADPRNYDVVFTFAKNAFFKNTTLTKSYSVNPPAGSPYPKPQEADLEADLYQTVTKIDWTSPEHDLTKKCPRPQSIEDLEEFDEFGSPGSWFNLFLEDGADDIGLGELLLEWWPHAAE